MATKKPSSRKKKPGTPLAQRLAHNPALVKKYQTNPGLRAKYLTGALEKYLTPAQRQSRALNTRLNSPITPGSSTTERDLAHEAQAAVGVRYGPQDRAIAQQLGVAMQTERDTGSLYDQYRQALQQHSAAVQAYQAGAQSALAGTAAGITGLGQQAATQMAQSAAPTQSAVAAPSADLATLANQALATRQGVMGTFQGEQALQGAASNTYSDTLANVVAPGQKLGALAQAAGRTRDVRKSAADLATEKGAFDQQFRQERRADEFKNQLAMQTLGLNQQKAAVDAAATSARVQQSSPAGVAATSSARASASTAAKYGYTAHQWAMLGPKGRSNVIAKAKKSTARGTDTVYTSGAFAGRKKSDIAAMSDAQRQKIVNDYAAGKGKTKTGDGAKPNWQTTQRQSAARSQVASLKRYAAMAKRGEAFVAGHGKQAPADRHAAAIKIQQAVAAPDDPILLTAALDAAYDGRISRTTVRKLIAAGYKPSLIASALGVGTGPTPRPSNRTTRPGSGNSNARA